MEPAPLTPIEEQYLIDFKEVVMTDLEFSEWLKHCGWDGAYSNFNNSGIVKYTLATGTVLALVKYKNDSPVNRWIYLPKDV